MAIYAKPSRSYAEVDHDPNGLSGAGNAPYGRREGFKTYRPCKCFSLGWTMLISALVETHLKRPAMYDPNPNSAFSPLPPAFSLSRTARKDAALAGQRAELDQILAPGYRASQPDLHDDASSIAGPSRSTTTRTSGGFGEKKKAKGMGLGLRPSASLHSFKQSNPPTNGRVGGIYVDGNGKVHDTEFDPFGNIAEMTRRKSRRRSAFGADRHKGSDSESSSASGSDSGYREPRKSMESGTDGDEIRRKLEVERRRLDEVSGLSAARRRSMMSDKHSGATPSIRSSDDGLTSTASTQYDRVTNRSKSQQGYYVPSPLSPTFGQSNGHAYTSRNLHSATALEHAIEESPPQKSTERTSVTPKEHRTPHSVSVTDKKITVTGFDAPHSARPLTPLPDTPNTLADQFQGLRVPDSARLSSSSRRSSESTRPKPAEPPRENLFPETPAQIKRREERERRAGLALGGSGMKSRAGSLGIDTALSQSGRGRVLPEIEIVEDDDPRIVFPEHGKSTRVQKVHDHVIRGPFSHALNAQAGSSLGRRASADHSARSVSIGGGGGGSKPPSTIIDQGQGGYLPSRWASGDHQLRVTEGEKEKYRPREWGGKTGDLGGKAEEWR